MQKTASPKKINSEKMFTNVFLYQITPLRSKVSFFESFCSFKVGCFTAIKIPPGFFLRNVFWCCLQNWKTMFNVLKELFGWLWIFVWIFIFIPTSNNISFSFTYVIIYNSRVDPRFYMNDIDVSPLKVKTAWFFLVFQTILKS